MILRRRADEQKVLETRLLEAQSASDNVLAASLSQQVAQGATSLREAQKNFMSDLELRRSQEIAGMLKTVTETYIALGIRENYVKLFQDSDTRPFYTQPGGDQVRCDSRIDVTKSLVHDLDQLSSPPPRSGEHGVPAYVTSENSCSLVVAGGGMQFDDVKINEFWFQSNVGVANVITTNLQSKGYKVEKFILGPPGTYHDSARLVGIELAKRGCNKIVQLLNSTGNQPGGKYFEFEISILSLSAGNSHEAPSDRNYILVGEYKKSYRFDMTQEVMDKFSFTEMGASLAKDIDQTGILRGKIK